MHGIGPYSSSFGRMASLSPYSLIRISFSRLHKEEAGSYQLVCLTAIFLTALVTHTRAMWFFYLKLSENFTVVLPQQM